MSDLPSDTEAPDQNQVSPDKTPTRFLDQGHPDSPPPYPTYAQAGQADTRPVGSYAEGSQRAAAESARLNNGRWLTAGDPIRRDVFTTDTALLAILSELHGIRGLLGAQVAPGPLSLVPEK